jgi:ArsR family transcriptional regulator
MTQTSKQCPRTPRQAAGRPASIDAALAPALFKALADPTRVRLLACLAKCRRACSVTEVAQCCHVDFSVVSRHLALLAAAGVVESVKQSRTVLYRVRCAELAGALRRLADAFDECRPVAECEPASGCRPNR